MPPPDPDHARSKRILLIAASGLFSLIGACIYHDTCIKVNSPGDEWCRNIAGARQWNAAEGGTFEDGIPIIGAEGCDCFNVADNKILFDQEPECQYHDLIDPMETKARQACAAMVNPGWTSNCWVTGGSQAPIIENPYPHGKGDCIGDCEFILPPVGGSCPNPSPYECAGGSDTGGSDDGCGEAEGDADTTGDGGADTTGDGGADTTGDGGSDTTGDGLLPAFVSNSITCDGPECDVDLTFAQALYDTPERLLYDSARLEYDPMLQRHRFIDVVSGDVAYELGLRTNDVLESVDGMVIEDLESGLEVYATLESEDEIVVRVKRGTSWIDFTYTFVP